PLTQTWEMTPSPESRPACRFLKRAFPFGPQKERLVRDNIAHSPHPGAEVSRIWRSRPSCRRALSRPGALPLEPRGAGSRVGSVESTVEPAVVPAGTVIAVA